MISYKASGLDVFFAIWLISILIFLVIGAIFGWVLFARRYADILDLMYEEGYIDGHRKAYEERRYCANCGVEMEGEEHETD